MKIADCEIRLVSPSAEEVKACLKNNADLLGEVEVIRGGTVRRAVLPLPYEGVFVCRNFAHARADRLVWSPYLVDAAADDLHVMGFEQFLRRVLERRIREARGDVTELNLEGLVPVRILLKRGLLTPVRPQNPLELLAALRGVRRFPVSRQRAALYGLEKRLNVPAFEGRICPIETPESELVGIQLQLARGATVGEDGALTPAGALASFLDKLGWGASLIPFVNYNDSARNAVGAKNLRQALVLEEREAPLVRTGTEAELVERMRPLMDAGLCPAALDAQGALALGCNLLVAYMPWFGWNFEDAVVVSARTAQRMRARTKAGDVLPLKLGDKLTGRHGNKGVVSRILPDDQMPKLPDGTPIDILLNPHGILSRMNPGQLLETHLGWLYRKGVPESEVLAAGRPNHDHIRERLRATGLDARGRVRVTLPDGTQTAQPVVVGYQYFVRLNHIPREKSHVDRTQRLGEMEVWALAAHEAHELLKEKLGTAFEKRLADELLVLGIGVERTQRGVRFRTLDDAALLAAMTSRDALGNAIPPQEVSVKADAAGYDEVFCASFGCREPGCTFCMDNVPSGGTKTLKLDHLLHQHGIFDETGVQINAGGGASAKSQVYTATYRLPNGETLHGYYQCRRQGAQTPRVGDFAVCCPRHPRKQLSRTGEMKERSWSPKTGGLFDPSIFRADHWGYIRLKHAHAGRTLVPVLPARYRRPLVEGMMDELSEAYAEVLRVRESEHPERALERLHDLIKIRLFGSVAKEARRGGGSPSDSKKGLLRRQGLGREVDHAARQVIVPNPELAWNEVGVPAEVYTALRDGRLPERETVLVLNRQPTLHKYGMQALHPRVMDGDEHVFQISPLVCGGFAADFDGDEMVAHFPLSDAAQRDARRLLPENNLLSVATGRPLAHFKLDFKSGAHLLGKGEREVEEISRHPETAVAEMSRFARAAFEKVTREGVSFGFYDLVARRGGETSEALRLIFDEAKANGTPEQMALILDRLLDGLDWAAFFAQSNDGRRRLCVKKINSGLAGGLTRRLVLMLWGKKGVEGLRAAQAIGERGLQVTQSATHGGALDIQQVRRAFLREGYRLDRASLPEPFRELKEAVLDCRDEVYAALGKDGATLDPLTRLAAGKEQWAIIEELARTGADVPLDSPFGKVFFNAF